MDLTPAFFDRWREHRELQYVDRVREVFDQADPDEAWLQTARRRARAIETQASLRHSGCAVGEIEGVEKALDTGATEGVGNVDVVAVQTHAAAYDVALAAAHRRAALTPALLDDLHARLCGDAPAGAHDPATDAPLAQLCDWLAAPPDGLHPVVVAALAHLELLRLRRHADGNARLARLALLLLLDRDGYGYRDLLSPSVAWRDPRQPLDGPAEQLSPDKAETHPATERVVHDVATAVRDMVAWVRAEETPGSLPALLFGFPLQP
jgi:Fic/DOC family